MIDNQLSIFVEAISIVIIFFFLLEKVITFFTEKKMGPDRYDKRLDREYKINKILKDE